MNEIARRRVFAPEDAQYLDKHRWRRVSAAGFEPNREGTEDTRDPSPEEIAACRLWLRTYAVPTKTIRPRTSYGYKHHVERWADLYVPNGAFIQAAILEGFRVERIDHTSINAVFALRMRRRGETPGPANDTGDA